MPDRPPLRFVAGIAVEREAGSEIAARFTARGWTGLGERGEITPAVVRQVLALSR